jgi:hypothetical protein
VVNTYKISDGDANLFGLFRIRPEDSTADDSSGAENSMNVLQKAQLKARNSSLEDLMLFHLKLAGRAELFEREYKFYSARRWRFDFADPWHLIAIECEGGSWVSGAHGRGAHFESDCDKYNAAVLAGWRVLRFTKAMIKDGRAMDTIRKALASGTHA